jgi:predicted metal-dependent phosphoesterase TrpH
VSLTVRIDPHVHSEASYDGTDPVELLLEQAAEIGLDAIVVTDHDVVHESVRAAELAPIYGLVGIPGVEVSTADGHLLALGVEEMPPRRAPMDETVTWIRDRGGVAIVPHPFQRSRHGVRRRRLADVDPDAIEVYNSWAFTGWKNRRARRYAATNGYPGVAGSDAHRVGYVGRAYTQMEIDDVTRADLTAEVVLDAIRDGATRVEGRRTPIPTSARHYAGAGARKSSLYAKYGAYRSGALARAGAYRSGTLAKTGALELARMLYRISPLSR